MEIHQQSQRSNLRQALLAGGMAGTAVDTALFPLGKIYVILASRWTSIHYGMKRQPILTIFLNFLL